MLVWRNLSKVIRITTLASRVDVRKKIVNHDKENTIATITYKKQESTSRRETAIQPSSFLNETNKD